VGTNVGLGRRGLGLLLLVAIVALAAFGSTASARQDTAAATAPKPMSAKEWSQLVTKAKQEGSVTIYSTQIPALINETAQKFKAKYGISVTVNRQVDNTLISTINADISAGKRVADLWVSNARPYVLGALENGWVADARGPSFFSKGFDRKTFAKPGKAWVAGTAVLGYAWNKSAYSQGMNSFTDLLNPALRGGKIGVLQPLSPAAVDFWLWIQESFGKDFVTKLAEQKPKLYASTTTMQPALASGEILAGSFIGTNVKDLIAQGAPIEFRLPRNAWNTPYYAMILKQAPHPAAAQLLANYMISPEGQAVMTRNVGAVLKNVPDTYYVAPRIVKLSELTPKKIADFQASWNAIFK
jgi:iron(III) transport system substrate-binding protein